MGELRESESVMMGADTIGVDCMKDHLETDGSFGGDGVAQMVERQTRDSVTSATRV